MMRPFAAWPKIFGYRGSAGTTPENTLNSLREAFEGGAKVVHFDVRLAKDGVPVLMHDQTLDRTTNGHGKVADFTSYELKQLDAGSWLLPQFAGEAVPTLDEALKLCAALDLRIVPELRPSPGRGEALAEAVLDRLETLWPGDRSLPLITSANADCLRISQVRQPAWPRGMVFDSLPAHWREAIEPLELTTLHGTARNPNLLLELVAMAKPVYAYVVNDVKRARSLSALGIAGIMTGYPAQMLTQGVLPPPREDMEITSGE